MAAIAESTPVCASPWKRGAAMVIDTISVSILSNLVGYPLGMLLRLLGIGVIKAYVIGTAVALLLGWLYWTLFESSQWQATPGKRLLGLIVTDLGGGALDFSQAGKRTICKVLSTLPIYGGYALALFTQRRQALHDLICDTLVLDGRSTGETPPRKRRSRSRRRSGR